MNKVIIQLTRIGDLLQTAQAIETSRCNESFHLVCFEHIAKPVEEILKKFFAKTFYIDLKLLFESPSAHEALESLKRNNNELFQTEYEECINLTFSDASSFLAKSIRAKKYKGLTRDHALNIEITDQWSQFAYSYVINSSYNPFNLVDIYRNIIGLDLAEGTLEFPKQKSGLLKKIVVHPFSSDYKKNWASYQWTDLLYRILKNDKTTNILIVGSAKEVSKADEIINSQALSIFIGRI